MEPRLDRRSLLRLDPPVSVVPGLSPSLLRTTLGLLLWSLGALEDLETRRLDGSRERSDSIVSNVAMMSRLARSNLSMFLEVRFSSFSAFNSGRMRRLMASSTVASSLGLLIDEVPET